MDFANDGDFMEAMGTPCSLLFKYKRSDRKG